MKLKALPVLFIIVLMVIQKGRSAPSDSMGTNQVLVNPRPKGKVYPPCAHDEKYEHFGHLRIKLYTRSGTYKDAVAMCKRDGAKLVSIHSKLDNDAIITYFQKHDFKYDPWIGAVRNGPHMFEWADGEVLEVYADGEGIEEGAYTNWDDYERIAGRPDTEKCLFFWNNKPNFRWDIYPCAPRYLLPALCQCEYAYKGEEGMDGEEGGDM